MAPGVTLAGCSSGGGSAGSSAAGVIKIAVVADLTGAGATTEGTADAGVRAAVYAINKAGGIKGRQIVLKSIDTQSTPGGAADAAREAVAWDPNAIVYAGISTGLPASRQVYSQAGIPVVSTVDVDQFLEPKAESWVFSAASTTEQIATSMVATLKNKLGSLAGKKIAFDSLDSSAANDIFALIGKDLKADGAEVVANEAAEGPITSYTAQAQKIVSLNADAVISITLVSNLVLADKALRAAGFTGPFIGTEGASSTSTLDSIKDPGFIAGRSFDSVQSGSAAAKAAAAVGADPDAPYFAFGWADGYLIAQAAGTCGDTCGPQGMTSALEWVKDYTPPSGVTYGPLSLSATKHFAISVNQYVSWQNGKIVDAGPPVQVG